MCSVECVESELFYVYIASMKTVLAMYLSLSSPVRVTSIGVGNVRRNGELLG